ncbi:TPA: ABC transporter permease [Vibrio cholerae]|uniref:ABC transporter permease n=1 Tax=Vibrio paracholerae TaxID=650003 RepID=A0ABD7FVA1_9VIBR|nr:ABC transporter permease [Vibrio paracholerae]RBM67062.1 ABC transporter permease [Vibrio paracholerae]
MVFYAIFRLEIKSFLTNLAALFWTFIYPVIMLVLLIFLFDPRNENSLNFYFSSVIGLTMLTIVSMSNFGLAQTICDFRSHNSFLSYVIAPVSYFSISMAIIFSRLVLIVGFSGLFITSSLTILGAGYQFNSEVIFLGFFALIITSVFCFGLAIIVSRYCRNSQTMLAIANIIYVYALMSSNVFIPLSSLPNWSVIFITTSPFYYFNNILLGAFSGENSFYLFTSGGFLFLLGLFLVWFASDRYLFLPVGRIR